MNPTENIPRHLRLYIVWISFILLCYGLGFGAGQRDLLLYGFVSQLFLIGIQASNALSETLRHGLQLRTYYALAMGVYIMLSIGQLLAIDYLMDQYVHLLPGPYWDYLPLLGSILSIWLMITLLFMPLVLVGGYCYICWLASRGIALR